ncbi:hypothetical protein QQP08_011674 [Theobroma cacao]|nr:hypothetical protein QQP08_011674 [Theobroma cacao]
MPKVIPFPISSLLSWSSALGRVKFSEFSVSRTGAPPCWSLGADLPFVGLMITLMNMVIIVSD